jgi:amino acid permease
LLFILGTHTKNGTSQIGAIGIGCCGHVHYVYGKPVHFRKKEPNLKRPFKAPVYPWFPGIALFITVVSMFAIIWFNFTVSIMFLQPGYC